MGSWATTTSPTGNRLLPGESLSGSSRARSRGIPAVSAFTLAELVLVAVVITVLVTAATPQLSRTARRLRVEQTAFELVHLLRAAHEQAVFLGTAMVWAWDAEQRKARVEPDPDPDSDPTPGAEPSAGASEILTGSSVPAGMSVQLTRNEAAIECRCVRFFPEGTSEQATLTVNLGDQTYTATVDAITSHVTLIAGIPAR